MLKNLETTPNLSRLFQSRVNMQRSNKQIPPLSQLETPTYSKKNFTSSVHELKLPKANLRHPELVEVKSLKSNIVNEKLDMLKNMKAISNEKYSSDILSRMNKTREKEKHIETSRQIFTDRTARETKKMLQIIDKTLERQK